MQSNNCLLSRVTWPISNQPAKMSLLQIQLVNEWCSKETCTSITLVSIKNCHRQGDKLQFWCLNEDIVLFSGEGSIHDPSSLSISLSNIYKCKFIMITHLQLKDLLFYFFNKTRVKGKLVVRIFLINQLNL